ncbi:MAG: SGNH/GDSL hydrolase family protein [Gemmatimonadaceae bacterium]|nr:SGNH/GDSL hydrolase family protein [Acetobacteraceae bacterium]
MPPLSLPNIRRLLAANTAVTIVALGSSSTQGYHSTDIGHSYPAVLQAELSAALRQTHVAVINRGIGGQDAIEMTQRIEADVLAIRPALVVWQVGANGAMKRLDPDLFRTLVFAGVKRLQDAGIDVVLMDNQRAPAIMASPRHIQIGQALADIAVATGAGLFGRGALMDQWRDAGHPFSEFVADDGIHHNDRGYHCVAKALSASILEGLGHPEAPVRSASSRR